MKITNGDVIRHCDDHELAQVLLLKSVGMVVEVLQAMGEHERVAQFWNLIDKNMEPLVDEQAEWLGKRSKYSFLKKNACHSSFLLSGRPIRFTYIYEGSNRLATY